MSTQISSDFLLKPVASHSGKKNERIEVLDVIKAFALLGIFIIHVIGPFSGWLEYLLPDQKQQLPTAALDAWLHKFIYHALSDKCRGAFSFLFGIAFFYQLQKAERLGVGFSWFFIKRLSLVFIGGVLHAYLLFAGDVLRYYAVCGLFLLLVYKWPPRKLLMLSLFFLAVLPLGCIVLSHFFPYSQLEPHKWEEVRNGFMGSSYMDLIKVNFFLDWRSQSQVYYKIQFSSAILGQFLLGLWAAKIKVFSRVDHFHGTLVKLCRLGFLIGILRVVVGNMFELFNLDNEALIFTQIVTDVVYFTSNQALILCYICGITLLFQRPRIKRLFLMIAPTGRMSLSNYLIQSFLGALIFYGIGLGHFGRIGPAISIPLTMALFCGQVIFSYYWLKRFKIGPFEWLMQSVLNWNGPFKTGETKLEVAS